MLGVTVRPKIERVIKIKDIIMSYHFPIRHFGFIDVYKTV